MPYLTFPDEIASLFWNKFKSQCRIGDKFVIRDGKHAYVRVI